MRYRKQDANGDYIFGNQQANFHIDTPEAVAQAVHTRLNLLRGEWFLDTSEGMPWSTEVLGERTRATYDMTIRGYILDTTGVLQIDRYESTVDTDKRKLSVVATITTIYGQTKLTEIM
ncbi:hypothetical protein ACIQVE_07015 [Pseudomonas sp. NPDC098747]|uniref:hypothetical protein n=1 Tax=Pseudomonas sp. NPDC098747 TaxID=3364487 RepID=UPI00383B8A14